MKTTKKNVILYLGFNSFIEYKRGVENVIAFQSKAIPELTKIYLYFGDRNKVYKWKNLICISIKMNILRFFVMNLLIWKFSKKYNRIIIHSHNYLMAFFLLRRINIFTVHDPLYYQMKSLNRDFTVLFKIIEIVVYKKTDLVHFISQYSKSQSLLKPAGNSIIIPNTSHLESMILPGNQSDTLSNTDDKPFAFSVRSIEERAGIDLLIEIAEKYQSKGDTFKFYIAGKGPLLEHFRNIIKLRALNNIVLLGYVSDIELVSYYRRCRIVILTAKYAEGFGLPIIEGYMFDKPVVASNVCAIPEVVIDNSFLFENNVDDVIDKINFGLNQDTIEYKKFYFKKFANQKIISEFGRLYDSCLNN